jgi:DNA polymerase II small subunit/DNA polymerase delta subunit B
VSHNKNESQNECIKHEMQIITSNETQKRKNKKQHRKSTEQLEVEGEANTTCETFTMLRGVINNELYDRIEKLTRIVNKASEESKQHPNDKSRADSDSAVQADYLEMALSKHVNAMQAAAHAIPNIQSNIYGTQ